MARLGLLLAVGVACGAAASPNYNAEVDAVRAMMEAARHHDGGDVPAAAKPKAQAAPADSTEKFPGLDKELLAHADRVADDLRSMSAPRPTAALATQKSSENSEAARKERAARFFATHGMGAVGKLLGEELSASAAAKATADAETARRRLASAVATPSLRTSMATRPKAPAEADAGLADIDAEEDAEDQAAQQRWKAVDALRRRAALRMS
eukprot:CAMPEP_0176059466 /NCGR_PEP_ID=MMETSP0120_2-20121206/29635_1 /TAXON_ID=160619 /ORGANISM="Kryptoperidinium foliaceum, Strain CCMP 1326" /LENGTH=209 /DNA_ID=CAMNT_0017393003 /DNA_START=65 /DNA_END=691 /DNA_ORIENTATION=-